MCELTKNIRWNKVLLSGFIYLVIAAIVRQIEAIITMNYYKMPAYFGLWSKVMMPKAGHPPLKFFLISFLFSLLTGITLAVLYEIIKEKLEKKYWMRILNFTLLTAWLSLIFFTLPVYLIFNAPIALILCWFVSATVIFFLATIVFTKILK